MAPRAPNRGEKLKSLMESPQGEEKKRKREKKEEEVRERWAAELLVGQ
jgi:hypothetical protein